MSISWLVPNIQNCGYNNGALWSKWATSTCYLPVYIDATFRGPLNILISGFSPLKQCNNSVPPLLYILISFYITILKIVQRRGNKMMSTVTCTDQVGLFILLTLLDLSCSMWHLHNSIYLFQTFKDHFCFVNRLYPSILASL